MGRSPEAQGTIHSSFKDVTIFFSYHRNTENVSAGGRSLEAKGTIYSPFKDVPVPDMTFTEYVFSKLDQYKNSTCMVSF